MLLPITTRPNLNHHVRKYLAIMLAWSVLIGGSLAWNLHQLERNTLNNAIAAARASLAKDIGFRNWVTSHGGVYVPPTAHTPPNPYLKVPERDVLTTEGVKLTLMNPAYALREVQEHFGGDLGITSHLTSLKLFNPKNAPDEWETQALKSFDLGSHEALGESDIAGKPHLRLMLPLPVTAGCLKCHSEQGYKVGDVRGGIGAFVLMAPYRAVQWARIKELSVSHGVIYFLGILGLVGGYRREKLNFNERAKNDQALQQQLTFSVALNKIAKSVVEHEDAVSILEDAVSVIGRTLEVDRALFYDIAFDKQLAIGLAEWLNPMYAEITATKATYPFKDIYWRNHRDTAHTKLAEQSV